MDFKVKMVIFLNQTKYCNETHRMARILLCKHCKSGDIQFFLQKYCFFYQYTLYNYALNLAETKNFHFMNSV